MWTDVAALLETGGIEAVTVELPTIGEQYIGADFYADARASRPARAPGPAQFQKRWRRAFSSGQLRSSSSPRAIVRTGAAPIWLRGCSRIEPG
jgi:hypothetical protein